MAKQKKARVVKNPLEFFGGPMDGTVVESAAFPFEVASIHPTYPGD